MSHASTNNIGAGEKPIKEVSSNHFNSKDMFFELSKARIPLKNLVYVIGLAPEISKEEVRYLFYLKIIRKRKNNIILIKYYFFNDKRFSVPMNILDNMAKSANWSLIRTCPITPTIKKDLLFQPISLILMKGKLLWQFM